MQAYTPITPPPTPRKPHQFSSECGILSPTTTVPSRRNHGVPNSPARSPSYAVTFTSTTPANDAVIFTRNTTSQSNIPSQEGNVVNDERLNNVLNYSVVPANQNPTRECVTNAIVNDVTRLTENHRDRSLSNTIINNVSKSNTNTTKTHNCFTSTAKSNDVIESTENKTRFLTNDVSRNDVIKHEENSEFVISVKLPRGTNNKVVQQKAELLSRLLTQTFQSDIDSHHEKPIILQDPPKGKQSHKTNIPVDRTIRNDRTSSSTDYDTLTTTINDVAVSAVDPNNITSAKVDHYKQELLASQDNISNKSMNSTNYTPPTEPCDLSINSNRQNQDSMSNISHCHSPMYTNCSSKINELTPTHSGDTMSMSKEKFPITPHKTNENSYFIFPDVTQNANIHGYCDTAYSDRQQQLHCDNSTSNNYNANSMSCDQTQTYSNAALHRSFAPSSSSSMANDNLTSSNSAQIPTLVHSCNSKSHTPSNCSAQNYVISNAKYTTSYHPMPSTHEQTNINSQNSPHTAHFPNQHGQNNVKFQEHISNQNQDKCVSVGCCNPMSRDQITHNSVTRNDVTFENRQEVERCKRNLFGSPEPPRSQDKPGMSDDVINLLRSRGILNDDQVDYIASESHHSIPCSSHDSICQSYPINSDTCQSHSHQSYCFDSDTCQSRHPSPKTCQSHTAIRDTCQSSYRNHNNSMDDQYPTSPSYQVIIIPSSPRKRHLENLSNIDDVTPPKKCSCSSRRTKPDDVPPRCSHPSCRENCYDIRSSLDRSYLAKHNHSDSSPMNGLIEPSQHLLNGKYEHTHHNVSDTDGLSNKTSKRPRFNSSHIGESGMSSVGKRLGNGSCSNHKQKCSCSVFETHILNMARGAYQKVGRYNSSQGAFEQFRKELAETNGIVLDSLRMLNDMKRMCSWC